MFKLPLAILVFAQVGYRVGCECAPMVTRSVDAGGPLELRLERLDGGRLTSVSISGDRGATWWCLSEEQPRAPEGSCVGGQGPRDGGFELRPERFLLSPGDGSKEVTLWIGPSLESARASVEVNDAPPPPTFRRWPTKVSFSRRSATRIAGGCTEPQGTVELSGAARGQTPCGADGGWAVTLDFSNAPEGPLALDATLTKATVLLTSRPARKVLTKDTVACSDDLVRTRVPFGRGDGSPSDPFLICTPTQLLAVQNEPTRAFVLGDDLELSSMALTTSVVPSFRGTFDGRHFVVDGLQVSGGSPTGLFGALSGTVRSVVLQEVAIVGAEYTGALVGSSGPGSKVIDCHVLSGRVESTAYHYGALVGHSEGDIDDSSASAEVGRDGPVGYAAGGLVGHHYAPGVIRRSFATGSIRTPTGFVGGLVGRCEGRVEDSYATGAVTAFGDTYVGGLTGELIANCAIARCYSTGRVDRSGAFAGGLAPENAVDASVVDSFWDLEGSGAPDSGAGVGLTARQFADRARFTTWDFEAVWVLDGGIRPTLRVNPE